jgi:4-amino-4-deoxy-L-arabinose transferase-like glycosyltransferase
MAANPSRLRVIIISLLFVAAFVPRIILAVDFETVWFDQTLYCNDARNILNGRWAYIYTNEDNFYTLQPSGLSIYNHPFYPLLTAALSLATRDVELSAAVLSLLFNGILILCVYLICREFMDELWSVGAVSVLLFSSSMMILSASKYAESVYLGLTASSVYAMVVYCRGERGLTPAFLSGLLLGCAYLTKPEAFGLIPFFLLVLLGRSWIRESAISRKAIYAVFLFTSSFALTVLPYVIYLRAEAGSSGMPKKAVYNLIVAQRMEEMPFDRAFWELNEDGTDTILSERTAKETAFQIISSDLSGFMRRSVTNSYGILNHLLPKLTGLQGALFAVIILAGALRVRKEPRELRIMVLLTLFAICQVLPYSILFFLHRPVSTLIPVLTILLFYSVSRVISGVAETHERTSRVLCCLVIVVVMLKCGTSLFSLDEQIEDARSHGYSRDVGLWLKENTAPETIIMSREPDIPYYAERAHVILPRDDVSRVYAYAARKGAAILVRIVTEDTERGVWDAVTGPVSGRLIKSFTYPHLDVMIYEIESVENTDSRT